ncbi:MAG TPA: glycosyltransferase, partial [Nitrospira sp.]|nr:glycosyltransferase [Nitrospira sp.]
RWGVDPERIEVVRNAIDIEEMQSAAITQPGDLKGIADIIGKGRYMVAVGRLSPEKGHRVLVEAMSQVVRQCPDVRLFIIGEGQEADVLLDQIRTLGLDGHVRLAGFSRQVASYIRHAAMLVNPSYSEGLPNVVLEARALNKPIVATKVGGVPEIMADGCGGWLVPPGDPEAMARAIIRLWEGGDLVRKRLVEEGYGEFQHRFDAGLQTECLLGIYDALRGNLNGEASVGQCV